MSVTKIQEETKKITAEKYIKRNNVFFKSHFDETQIQIQEDQQTLPPMVNLKKPTSRYIII